MNKANVFISYKHDATIETFVELLHEKLENNGFLPWIDWKLRPGEDWSQGIDTAIKAAFALIVVMTPEARQSEYVTYEWASALGNGVPVIPILFKHTEIHPRLARVQYIDFTRQKQWDRLITVLRELEETHSAGQQWILRDAPNAIRSLVAQFDSKDTKQRLEAVETLSRTHHPLTKEALALATVNVNQDVRVIASFKLSTMTSFQDHRAIPGLLEALQSHEESIRYNATVALRDIYNALRKSYYVEADFGGRAQIDDSYNQCVERMLFCLQNEISERVREVASELLSILAEPVSVDELSTFIEDKNRKVRKNIFRALRKIASERPIPYLLSTISRTSDDDVAYEIFETLETIGVASFDGLYSLLDNLSVSRCRSAVSNLERIAGIEIHLKLLGHPRNIVRGNAIERLERFFTREGKTTYNEQLYLEFFNRLVEMLATEINQEVRESIPSALRAAHEPSIAAALYPFLDDKNNRVKRSVISIYVATSSSEMLVESYLQREGFGEALTELEARGSDSIDKLIPILEVLSLPKLERVVRVLFELGGADRLSFLFDYTSENVRRAIDEEWRRRFPGQGGMPFATKASPPDSS